MINLTNQNEEGEQGSKGSREFLSPNKKKSASLYAVGGNNRYSSRKSYNPLVNPTSVIAELDPDKVLQKLKFNLEVATSNPKRNSFQMDYEGILTSVNQVENILKEANDRILRAEYEVRRMKNEKIRVEQEMRDMKV